MMEALGEGIAIDIDETLAATNRFWIAALMERFVNPDNLTHDEIVTRYRYTQKVPFWQTPEALSWMEEARISDALQEAIPLIENSNHVVEKLQQVTSIAGYLTARPECVRSGTKKWLAKHGFPEAPLVMRPDHLSTESASTWKGQFLASLYPRVWGIIDDNPSILAQLPKGYKGTIFLYDHPEELDSHGIHVVHVRTWDDVLPAVSAHPRSGAPELQS